MQPPPMGGGFGRPDYQPDYPINPVGPGGLPPIQPDYPINPVGPGGLPPRPDYQPDYPINPVGPGGLPPQPDYPINPVGPGGLPPQFNGNACQMQDQCCGMYWHCIHFGSKLTGTHLTKGIFYSHNFRNILSLKKNSVIWHL